MFCNLSYRNHFSGVASLAVFVLIGICTLLPQEVFATHIVGGQMTYECLGNNRYRITVEMRRDCFEGAVDAQFDDPMSIGVYDGLGNLQLQIGVGGQLFIPFNDDDTLNEILTSECQVLGEDVCVHTTTYSTVVTLPKNLTGYNLVYQRCCRNQFLANIVQPLNTGATWYVNISPAAQNACNSSPKFKDWPSIYLCTNDEIQFDHSAIDADGDSLVYFLCRPTAGANRVFPKPQPPPSPPFPLVNYTEGFSAEVPMGAEEFSLDTETGLMTVLPTLQSQYLIGVCVDEYRDGVFMGRVRRDFEYNVRICIDDPMAAFEVLPNDTICNSLEVSFQNNSADGIELDYKWYFDYPDPNITSIEINPTHTYEKPGLYEVVLVSTFGDCSDTARQFVGVSPDGDPLVDFDVVVEDCTEDINIQLTDLTQTEQEITSWEWEITYNGENLLFSVQNPSFSIPEGEDSLLVRLQVDTESGCTGEKEMYFKVGIIEFELIGDTTICNGDSIQLVTHAMEGLTYEWSPDSSLDLTNPSNPIASPSETTSYTVSVTLGMCTMEYMVTVTVENEKDINISVVGDDDQFICTDSVQLMHNYEEGEVQWFSDSLFMESLGISNPLTLTGIPPEGQTIYALLLNDVCESNASLEILRKDFTAVLDFQGLICEGDTITPLLSVSNSDYEYTYEWQPSEWIVSGGDTEMPSFFIEEAGIQEISYKVTNQFGCSDSGTMSFNVGALPVLDLVNDQILQCENDSIDLNPNGDPVYNYLWNSINSDLLVNDTSVNPRVSVDDTTQFEVVVTTDDIYECSVTDTITIFRSPDINLELITPDQIICPGSSIDLEATTEVDAQLDWFDSEGILVGQGDSISVTPDTTTMYTIRATDAQNCTAEATVLIEVSPDINLRLSDNALQVCFTTTVTLTAMADTPVSYEWTDESGTILSTSDSLVLNAMSDSLITVTATDVNGCTESAQIQVNTEAEIGLMVEAADTITCFGEMVTFTAMSGSGTMIQWFDAADELVAEGNELTVTADTTTSFHIVASNDFGCTDDTTVVFEVSPQIGLGLTTSPDTRVCYGTPVSLSASAMSEVTFEWRDQSGTILSTESTLQFTATTDSLITVTATDVNDCTESEQVQIIVEDEIGLIVEAADTITCFGEMVTFTAMSGSGTMIQWFDAADQLVAEGNELTVTADTTTSFHIIASNDFGCTEDTTIVFEVSPEIGLTASADTTVCFETEVTLMAFTGSGIGIEWQNQQGMVLSTEQTFSFFATRDSLLTVFATDQYGCVESEDVMVSVIDDINLQVETPPDIVCFEQRTFINANTDTDATIEWYDSTGTILLDVGPFIVISLDSTTSFYVKATDEFGCMDDTTVTVEVYPEIVFSRTPDTLVCYGEEVILVAESPIGQLSYAWLNQDNDLLSTDSTVSIVPVSDQIIRLVIINTNGCSVMDNIVITVTEEIGLTVDYPMAPSCYGDTVTFVASASGSGTQIEWFNAFEELIGTGPEIQVTADSTTSYSVKATDNYGCMEDTSFVFEVAPEILFTRTLDTTICRMEEIVLTATGSGSGMLTFEWFNLEGQLLSDADTVSIIPMDTTQVVVVATDEFGCTASDTANVMISPPINLDAGEENFKYCEGESKTLTVSAKIGTMIIWYDGDGNMLGVGTSTITINPVDTMEITVVASDQYGCSERIDTVLTPYTLDLVAVPEDVLICEGEQAVLGVVNNDPMQTFTYLWTPVESIVSDNMMAQVTVQPDTTTEYTVFLTNQDGCMFDTTVTVTVSDIPEDIMITADPEEICLGQTTQLEVAFNPDYTYSWTPADIMDNPNIFNPVAMPTDEFTDIMVLVTNPDGCTTEDVLNFFTEQPLCTEEDIFIPNMFTPNGDGVNDVFQVESNYIDELFLTIYNRWGQKVFETNDPMGAWDGTFNNEPLGTGVFGYYVEVVCLNQFEYTSQGNVTLLR